MASPPRVGLMAALKPTVFTLRALMPDAGNDLSRNDVWRRHEVSAPVRLADYNHPPPGAEGGLVIRGLEPLQTPTIGVSNPAHLSGIPNPVPSLTVNPKGVRSYCDLLAVPAR
ncbi:hypothetical protein BSY16_6214 (plasmid) [Sinorhizobium sp. RAC02]|nr:hypothetical protein BSY16_6214 [Sinorhizobium sp. RAC02]